MTQRRGGGDSPANDVIADYEVLWERSSRMLALACDEDWSRLLDEEASYVVEVERLSRKDASQVLDAMQRERKAELLEGILENDLEIRRRLTRRRDELGALLNANQRKRSVDSAYGAGHRPKVLGGASRFQAGDA